MRYLNIYADLTAPPRPWSSAESAEPLRAPRVPEESFPRLRASDVDSSRTRGGLTAGIISGVIRYTKSRLTTVLIPGLERPFRALLAYVRACER